MRLLRNSSMLGLALLLTVGVGCTSSDTTTSEALGPSTEQQQTPSFGLIGDLTGGLTDLTNDLTGTVVGTLGSVTDLLVCSSQPYAATTQTIGPSGGVLNVGSHSLAIPSDALTQKVTITAEQIPGSTNSVRFSPEGLKFAKPAKLSLSYANCSPLLLLKRVVYTDELLRILELIPSLDNLQTRTVTGDIRHFSRYAVAW
jgi:hypothetical protein